MKMRNQIFIGLIVACVLIALIHCEQPESNDDGEFSREIRKPGFIRMGKRKPGFVRLGKRKPGFVRLGKRKPGFVRLGRNADSEGWNDKFRGWTEFDDQFERQVRKPGFVRLG